MRSPYGMWMTSLVVALGMLVPVRAWAEQPEDDPNAAAAPEDDPDAAMAPAGDLAAPEGAPESAEPAMEPDPTTIQTGDEIGASALVDTSGESTGSSYVDIDESVASPYAVEIGLTTGIVLPQLSSELSTAAGVKLDVGVPVWKALSAVGAIGYSQPSVDSNLSDPRLAGEMYSTETRQRELTLTLGASWRFLKATSRLNAYAGLGGRIWLLETLTNGEVGGVKFGENREQSTRLGAAGWGGAEFLLGPGALTAELDVGGSDLPHLVTGDVATTAASFQVGYRLRL